MSREQVLITGAAGRIGRILGSGLADAYDVRGIDLRAAPGTGIRRRNVRHLQRVLPVFRGCDVVIDLAADPSVRASWRDVRRTNLVAPYTALEAARRTGARRVIFASSHHVTGLYERDQPYADIAAGKTAELSPADVPLLRTTDPIRPDSLYGAAKAWGEALCRYYAEEFGISTICLRIGTVNGDDRPSSPRERATLLSHRDLVHLVDCCIRAPRTVRHAVFYGVSDNTWRFWDIEDAHAAIGYEPRDDAERLFH